MEQVFSWIINITMILILIFLVYLVMNYTEQYNRLKRRYDNLLRGRGNLNMEQLLSSHGEDIDKTTRDLLELREEFENLSQHLGVDQDSIEKNYNDILNRIDRDYQIQFNEIKKSNETGIQDVQGDLNLKIDNLEKDLEDINKRFRNEIFNLDTSTHSKIDEMNGDLNLRMDNFESDVNNRLDNNKELLNNNITNIREWVNLEIEKTNNNLDSKIKIMEDYMSFSIQKVALYRYDAFDSLSNKLSYSLVLLDEHNDGVILTSIFGRNGSSMYAKNVKAGKSETPLSPEEEKALQMAKEKR